MLGECISPPPPARRPTHGYGWVVPLIQGFVASVDADDPSGLLIRVRPFGSNPEALPRAFLVRTTGSPGALQLADAARRLVHGQEVTLSYVEASPTPTVDAIS